VPQGQPATPPDLVDALRWHWKLGLMIALFVLIGGVIYAEVQPSEYDGVAVVAFTPKPGVGSDVVHVVVAKYETYAGSRALAARLAPDLGESTGTLDDAVSTSTSQDTGNLTLRVRLRDPEQAAAAANAYAQAVLDRSADDDLVNSDLAAPALRPTAPSAPPRRLIEVAALLAGVVAGGAVAFVLARARPRFRSWRELGAVTGYPVVARLPSHRALRSTPVRAASDPHVLPAVHSLQAALQPQLLDRSGVLAITSATRRDGRTSAAVVFAEGLARAGYQVLLIDADLQKPRLGKLARTAVRPGLLSALSGDGLQSAMRRGWVEGLWVLPTAKDSRGADALASAFPNFVAALQGRVDVVIIDAAPVLGAREAQAVIPGATGVLLVVPRTASQQEVGETILAVESLGTPLLGIVANRFATSPPMRA
jgi:Mrp family chromosome partitioning ATPase/capsular polysaccharide biosynthesis protein